MGNPKFEAFKLKKVIAKQGKEYIFSTRKLNDFKEKVGELESVTVVIKGLYHEQNGYINLATKDAAKIQSKKKPMILTSFQDVKDIISIGNEVTISNVIHKVTGVLNINDWDLIADISLEVIGIAQ